MFRKRVKKEYPEGTFIATPARVMAILQLCLVFTVICWQMSKPFMADLYHVKSKMAVFDFVLKDQDRFSQLGEDQRQEILRQYAKLQDQLTVPFVDKMVASVRSLFGMSPTLLIWLMFGTLVPILLLKKVEGARQVIWLMPLVAAAYCVENRYFEPARAATREEKLFPSEALIVKEYLGEPLSSDVFVQREQLKTGWDNYLIQVWGKGKGVEEGLFHFNVERALALGSEAETKNRQHSLFFLGLFLFWNLSFALVISKAHRRDA